MARRRPRKHTGPTPVEAIRHDDKRVNIPTADSHDFVDDADKEPVTVLYPRDPSLDPQLVWSGKDEQDTQDLAVTAPPLYIQEKIDPRVLVENLRRTAEHPDLEPEFTLFDTFDGLDGWQTVQFYRHDANWSNRMILGDSLEVMASVAERENLRSQVQMVYIDPPYGIKFGSNWQVRSGTRDMKDGKFDDATREVEQIKAFRDTWELGIHSYLAYMRERLLAARDLLAESGSVFVQIGDTNVHLMRNLLDEVFGSQNWVTTISVTKTSSSTNDFIGGTADYVHWYAKSKEAVKFHDLYREKLPGGAGAGMYTRVQLPDGERRNLSAEEKRDSSRLPAGSRIFRTDNLTSQSMGRDKGEGAASWFPVQLGGRVFRPSMQARWKTNEQGMDRLILAGRVVPGRTMPAYVRFLDDFPAFPYTEIWSDLGGARSKRYVVETAPKIIERCMLMCTDPGDLVLDPTCGSGTTAFVAEQWGRRWITIDTSRVALTLARQRIMGARYPHYLLADSTEGRAQESSLTGEPSPLSPPTRDVRQGFVYKRVPHVTLKSIANNPHIREDMSREDIDAAIARHADTELLYDQPYEDKSAVRVAGPFTVETLSPHRAVSTDVPAPRSESGEAEEESQQSFERMLLENLVQSGVQNGRRPERLVFSATEMLGGKYLLAKAIPDEGSVSPVDRTYAVSIGPRYGTVGADWIKGAAREAMKGRGFDVLLVLGFAFDPRALETVEEFQDQVEAGFSVTAETRSGSLRILLVRMNADLAMGEGLLKKSKAANLFTVFGEPDVTGPEWTEDGWVVGVRGFDVYNPITGEIRSGSAEDIAMWMIDTDYNEESFFVRHCYFPAREDPYKRLKTALKADIDEAAWATLNSTNSRPFPHPGTGKIAVKVINDYGDEVLRVIDMPDPPA